MNLVSVTYLQIESYSNHPEVAKAARILVDSYFAGKHLKRDEAKLFRDAKKLVASLWIRNTDMFRFTTKKDSFTAGKRKQVWMTNRTLKLFKVAEGLGWFNLVQKAMPPWHEQGVEGRAAIYCRTLAFRKLLRGLTVNDVIPDPDLPRVELRDKDRCIRPLPVAYLQSSTYSRTVKIMEEHFELIRASAPTLEGKPVSPAEYRYTRKFSGDLKRGGRFYAPFVNWPKKDRLKIQFNGEPVGSLDISQLHPALLLRLMHKADRELSGMLLKALPEVYSMPRYEWLPRAVHKKLINTLLNAETRQKAAKALSTATWWFNAEESEWCCNTYKGRQKRVGQPVFPDSPMKEAESYIAYFEVVHSMLAPAVCSGRGLVLQRLDSDLIENILWIATVLGVPVLPVHDEIILPQSMKSFAQVLLEKAFPLTFGDSGNFGIIEAKWTTLTNLVGEIIQVKLSPL